MDFSAQLIKNNIELLSFGYGVVFVLMGAALAGQRAVGKNIRIPVRLLAAFGLVHGFGEWLMTWSLVNGALVPVTITRILAIAAAGVLLIEFSRRLALEADTDRVGHKGG